MSRLVFDLQSNFADAREAVGALRCPLKLGLAATPERIPMEPHPVNCRVVSEPLQEPVLNPKVLDCFPKAVDLVTFLTFVGKLTKKQFGPVHFTVWKAEGKLWYAAAGHRYDGYGIEIDECSEEGGWLTTKGDQIVVYEN